MNIYTKKIFKLSLRKGIKNVVLVVLYAKIDESMSISLGMSLDTHRPKRLGILKCIGGACGAAYRNAADALEKLLIVTEFTSG